MPMPSPIPSRSLPARALHAASVLALGALLAPGAWAQIDLPQRPPSGGERPPQHGNQAPYLVCTACGERNYTAPRSAPMGPGLYQANCRACRTSRLHRDPQHGAGPDLELPGQPRPAPRTSGLTGPGRGPAGPAPTDPPPPGLELGVDPLEPAARRVLEGLVAAGDDPQHALVPRAVEGLLELGPPGVRAARAALVDARGATALVGARVLLRAGDAADAERIVERLRRGLPRRVGPAVLEELLRLDPVHGSPALLVELLDHGDFELRNAAQRHLVRARGPELLPHLPAALKSRRVDTRLRAVELLASIDDPGVLDLLLEHHADSSPQVAGRITEALGQRDDPRVELELLARAFASRWILRDSAYALLAIVDREDRTQRALLEEAHVETLLRGLSTREAFVSGVSAVALAGIGFRSPDPGRSAWLDREVMDPLVYAVSGKEFHQDFSALVPRAERRLRLLTGKTFGIDGPAWVGWWIESRDGFRARRAWLPLGEAEVDGLVLRLRELGGAPLSFTLLGPAADAAPAAGEVLRLSGREVRGLAQLLAREGVLGPERLPGARGSLARGSRSLELEVGPRGKSFEFGPRVSEPWFERLVAAARDLADRNRWQRFPDLVRYRSAHEFWMEESGWWSLDEPSDLERAQRLEGLVLTWLPQVRREDRLRGIEELERLYARPGVAGARALPALQGLIDQETFLEPRAGRLLRLGLLAGQAPVAPGAPAPPLAPGLARELCDQLLRRFGADAAQELGLVLAAAGGDFVRSAARDAEPLLRAVAARQLGLLGEPRDAELLLALLDDPERGVEAAAARALGRLGVDAARTSLLVRARIADSPVREAALRAIGELGGDYVLDALVLGLSERDPAVQEAAAEGLASLAEAGTAPLFVTLLAQGPGSPVYAHAVRGLEALGDAARGDLERVVRSPLHRSRRAATLLLAARLDPLAVEAAIEQLTERPQDGELAFELAVLSCVDYRAADDAPTAWRVWWRDVDRRNPGAWLRVAMDRRGMQPPSPRLMAADLSPELASALLELLERPEDFLVERGRRELARALGEPVEPPPADEVRRAPWLAAVRALVDRRLGRGDVLPE